MVVAADRQDGGVSTTLDTLQVAKDLQAASFSEQQAEALARLLRERQQADSSQLVPASIWTRA